MTDQPVWKFVENIGDVNPLDHGGAFIFIDETGVYDPEMEVVTPIEDHDNDRLTWEMHRFSIEKCTFQGGVLSDNKFHPDCQTWYADGLKSIADCMGKDQLELIEQLCSDDLVQRALGYRDVYSYYGLENFDQDSMNEDNRLMLMNRYRKYPVLKEQVGW